MWQGNTDTYRTQRIIIYVCTHTHTPPPPPISVKKSSDVGQPVPYSVPFSGRTLANAAREGVGMRGNSAYVSQEVESTDDDTTYDTIAEQ